MKDDRPLCSPAPEWVNGLAREFCDRLDPMFEELWEKAAHGAATAVEGGANAAEAQNDALSLFSQIAGYGILCMAEKIGKVKSVPPHVAFSVALEDAQLRATLSFIHAANKHSVEPGVKA